MLGTAGKGGSATDRHCRSPLSRALKERTIEKAESWFRGYQALAKSGKPKVLT